MEIRTVTAAAVRPLRGEVLRPGRPPEALAYPGDTLPGARHLAVVGDGGEVLGIASISPEPHPTDPEPEAGDWRLRGMATAPAIRGTGWGATLLTACVDHVARAGGIRLWCNARLSAEGFYRRHGFVAEGARFEIDGIGPHVVMTRDTRRP